MVLLGEVRVMVPRSRRVADRWPEFHWIADNIPVEQVVMTVNGGPSYTELVSCGYGAGILTCVEAKSRAALKRLSGPDPLIVRDIWLLVLPELPRNPAIRRVLDWIIAVAEQDAQALGTASDGQSPGASSDRGQ